MSSYTYARGGECQPPNAACQAWLSVGMGELNGQRINLVAPNGSGWRGCLRRDSCKRKWRMRLGQEIYGSLRPYESRCGEKRAAPKFFPKFSGCMGFIPVFDIFALLPMGMTKIPAIWQVIEPSAGEHLRVRNCRDLSDTGLRFLSGGASAPAESHSPAKE